jgi:hypothetical protein
MPQSNNTLLLAGLGLIGFGLYQLAKQSKGAPAGAVQPIGTLPPLIYTTPPAPVYVGGPPPGAYASSTQPGGPGGPSATLPGVLADTGYPVGRPYNITPLTATLSIYTQPRQPVAGVGQQGPGAGVIIPTNPPRPPSTITVPGKSGGKAGGQGPPVVIQLPAAQSVLTAGIRRQGNPY